MAEVTYELLINADTFDAIKRLSLIGYIVVTWYIPDEAEGMVSSTFICLGTLTLIASGWTCTIPGLKSPATCSPTL